MKEKLENLKKYLRTILYGNGKYDTILLNESEIVCDCHDGIFRYTTHKDELDSNSAYIPKEKLEKIANKEIREHIYNLKIKEDYESLCLGIQTILGQIDENSTLYDELI